MVLKIDDSMHDIFNPLTAEELNLLTQSILAEGVRDPIVTWNGYIIDGRHRYQIATENGIDFDIVEMEFASREDAINWMINNQLGKRNLSEGDKRDLRGKRYNSEKKEHGGDRKSKGHSVTLISTSEKLADQFDVNERTIKRDGEFSEAVDTIVENTGIARHEARNIGTAKDIHAIARMEPEKQREFAEQRATGEVKDYKEYESKQKQAERKQEIDRQVQQEVAMPSGDYSCVVIDPPWNYGTGYDPDGRRVANPYPEMTLEQIAQLDIRAKQDSIIFLWTTHKFIWDAKALLEQWGFAYRSMIVWDKEQMGMGDLFRMQCEFCLVGIKGKPLLDNPHNLRDIIRESRREHSRKPEAFYEMVETLCPYKKIEYFAREQREGYEVYGNDTDKFQ